MSQTLQELIGEGYFTRIESNKTAPKKCLACKHKFTVGDEVFRMNKRDGITIQCDRLDCFREQGGIIDKYQTNTLIYPKPKVEAPKPEYEVQEAKISEPQPTEESCSQNEDETLFEHKYNKLKVMFKDDPLALESAKIVLIGLTVAQEYEPREGEGPTRGMITNNVCANIRTLLEIQWRPM